MKRHLYSIPWPRVLSDADDNDRTVIFTVHFHYWTGYPRTHSEPAEPADVSPVHVDPPEGESQADADELLEQLQRPGIVADFWRERAVELVQGMAGRRAG